MQGIALFRFALTFPSVLTELELDVNEIDVKGFQVVKDSLTSSANP
jgi:hypothetical protein